MNPNALKEAADHFYALADLFTQLAADTPDAGTSGQGRGSAIAAPPSVSPAPSFDELPPEDDWDGRTETVAPSTFATSDGHATAGPEYGEEGSLVQCPKHRTPYKDGRYGPFCTQLSDDPAWRNSKGYCSLTPKNAAQYLRVKAAA